MASARGARTVKEARPRQALGVSVRAPRQDLPECPDRGPDAELSFPSLLTLASAARRAQARALSRVRQRLPPRAYRSQRAPVRAPPFSLSAFPVMAPRLARAHRAHPRRSYL